MLGIALGIAAVTSVVFGVLPALHLSRLTELQTAGPRGGGSDRGESRIRAALVVGQLVMATMLLVGAGLLTHSFINLSTFNRGYDPSNVLAFNLLFPDQYSTARKADTIETLLARFRGIPTVRSAGFSRHGLLIGEELVIGTFVPQGRTLDDMRDERTNGDPAATVPVVRRAVSAIDPSIGIDAILPMDRLVVVRHHPARPADVRGGPPTAASSMLSVNTCRTIRHRLAPSAA